MSRSINSNRPGGIAVVVSSVAIVLVAFSFVVVGCGSDDSNSAAAAASTANVVRATERQRLKALLEDNYDVANKLHAEDFELINPAGEVLSKEGYIDSGGAFTYTKWKPVSPIRVRVHGDSAVIRYESDLEINGSGGHTWHTDLYEKRDGQWQIVWSHATAAP